jgi:hypothetical protein
MAPPSNLTEPIALLGRIHRPLLFVLLFVAFLLFGTIMRQYKSRATKAREEAGKPGDRTESVDQQTLRAQANVFDAYETGVDALFIAIYVPLLWLGCRMAADGYWAQNWSGLAWVGIYLAWVVVAGAVFDVAENSCHLEALAGTIGSSCEKLGVWFTRLKWVCVLVPLFYVTIALIVLRSRFFHPYP